MNAAVTNVLPFCWECGEAYPPDEEYRPSTCARCSLVMDVDEAITRLEEAEMAGFSDSRNYPSTVEALRRRSREEAGQGVWVIQTTTGLSGELLTVAANGFARVLRGDGTIFVAKVEDLTARFQEWN